MQTQLPMSNLAIPPSAPTPSRLDDFTTAANGIVATVQNTIRDFINHRNRDDTRLTPRITRAVMDENYFVIALDDQTWWHYPRHIFLGEGMKDALSANTQTRVYAYHGSQLPEATRAKYGVSVGTIAYIIPLTSNLLAAPANDERLPREVKLDLSTLKDNSLTVPIGVRGSGLWTTRLDKIGHTLVVGTSGAGKSMWLHAAILSLFQNDPSKVQMLLIDPKRSEFGFYRNAPNVREVCQTPIEYESALEKAVTEMDERGEQLQASYCRDIQSFNSKYPAKTMPYLLVVIDEALELMLLDGGSKGRLSKLIQQIASRGRSAGVILWAATQHASAVDGLPRVVNANLTTRIVFRVIDESAARSAGCPGAQNLPKSIPGRMLVKGDGETIPAQGLFVDMEAVIAQYSHGGNAIGATAQRQDDRLALLKWSLIENGGYLTAEDIQTRTGLGHRPARALAVSLEREGLLAKNPKANQRRLITVKGIELVQASDADTA